MQTINLEALLAQLRAGDTEHTKQAADLIESQQKIMDKCATTLVEAIVSEDGIDTTEAEACVDAVRASFGTIGKTSTEQMLENLYGRIGAAAGFPAGTEFDPFYIIDQMRTCITVQSRNGTYLELLLPSVYWATPDGQMRLRLSPPNEAVRYMGFAAGTPWNEALDAALRAAAENKNSDTPKQAA